MDVATKHESKLKYSTIFIMSTSDLMPYLIIIFVVFLAVQHERGPRNSTIRRQMALYLKEAADYTATVGFNAFNNPLVSSLGMPLTSPFYATGPLVVPPMNTSPLPRNTSPQDQRIPPTHSPILMQPTPKV